MTRRYRRPEPGQTWRRKDPRDGGRLVTVLDVDFRYVHVRALRRSRVLLDNFVTAYEFVAAGNTEETRDA